MNYVKMAVLAILALIALSACASLVLWILGTILKIVITDIIYTGFKIAFVAFIVLSVWQYIKKKR